MAKDWIWFDWLVAALRYSKVNGYVKENSLVVDIGCGREGTFLKTHSKKIKHGWGFDFRIETHDEENISFFNNKESKEKLPLADSSVDDVFLNAVLEHLEDPVPVIKEAVRVLKKGGRIIMTTPTRIAKPILEFLSYKLHLINEDEIREHKHYYNKTDIKKLLESVPPPPPLYKQMYCRVSLEKYSIFELGVNSLIILRKE